MMSVDGDDVATDDNDDANTTTFIIEDGYNDDKKNDNDQRRKIDYYSNQFSKDSWIKFILNYFNKFSYCAYLWCGTR